MISFLSCLPDTKKKEYTRILNPLFLIGGIYKYAEKCSAYFTQNIYFNGGTRGEKKQISQFFERAKPFTRWKFKYPPLISKFFFVKYNTRKTKACFRASRFAFRERVHLKLPAIHTNGFPSWFYQMGLI